MIDPVLLDVGSRLPLGELWGSAIGFVIIFIACVVAMGLGSRTLAVPAYTGYLAFVYFAFETSLTALEPLMYVTVALVIIGAAMKTWRLEGFETGS